MLMPKESRTAKKVSRNVVSITSSKYPAFLVKNKSQYSVILNLFGIDKNEIFIDVDSGKHEFGIYIGNSTNNCKKASFWIFGVPQDGSIENLEVNYKGGGLEITVPRQNQNRLPAA
jgi:HSP20 family molecular chaperone IbpA